MINFYQAYLESLNKSPHTIKQYCIDSEQFLKFLEENKVSLDSDITKVVKNYITYLLDKYDSITSVNRKISSLKNFLNFLHMRNLIQLVPVDELKPLRDHEKKINMLPSNELKKVLRVWFDVYSGTEDEEFKWIALRNFCIVRLMAELSLKPAEVVKMKWTHIQNNTISIRTRKRARKLDVSRSMLNWLAIFKKEKENLFPESISVDYIWLGVGNRRNHPITEKTIERIFHFISKQLELKVTAMTIRYSTIREEVLKTTDSEVYKQFGYARNSVLQERLRRFS
ncbi:site-specific recombinase XerD [Ureibacillus xyleni]|uniref:Site-specific recombinase XerD n=1 Tax=Ureibacillus xyleni TaxID=614648 RepID=A0A285TS09_9BACL|nr:site-specific recombinase XerD [Ureibacillus xyleni]